eukprot:2188522-Pyramimonas_sp.AAC.1
MVRKSYASLMPKGALSPCTPTRCAPRTLIWSLRALLRALRSFPASPLANLAVAGRALSWATLMRT